MGNVTVLFDGSQIVPAPLLKINKEFIYANDHAIGFTYIITIDGYASSINGENSTTSGSLENSLWSLRQIQDRLHKNGKTLRVTCDNTTVLVAHGSQIRSFATEENDNRWYNYIKYTATIEFSHVFFSDSNNQEIAYDTLVDGVSGGSGLYNYLVKLKNYQDNWTFKIPEEQKYAYYSVLGADNSIIREDFTRIDVEYTISANGKHYYDSNGNGTTKMAWEVAKDFVQKKLYSQINIFRNNGVLATNGVFPTTNYNSTDGSQDGSAPALNSSQQTGFEFDPILSSALVNAGYRTFNEKITCSASESEGSFTATYSCILKIANNSYMPNSVHSIEVTSEKTRDFTTTLNSISVNGTVEGLLPTNILNNGSIDGQVFYLPNNGVLLGFNAADRASRYRFALQDFKNFVINSYGTDLRDDIKSKLNITYGSLFVDAKQEYSCVNLTGVVEPKSFSVSHNYAQGTINYTADYDSERSCAASRGFETFTITEEDPVPIIAEFVVVGRASGPILQDLNTFTNKKITLDFEGVTDKNCVVGTPWSPNFSGTGICNTYTYAGAFLPVKVGLMISQTEAAASGRLIPASHNYNYNPVDGSYKLSKSYIVCPLPQQ